jgi:hypothetical protein
MKLYLEFENIIDQPVCQIDVNGQQLYRGVVNSSYEFDVTLDNQVVDLHIAHQEKKSQDTVVENGNIVRDRSFEIKKIIVDGYDFEELIWRSEFRAEDRNIYKSCLFFGPNGTFVLTFTYPVLYWILKTRHETNHNDPYWEQDYNYYTHACKILKQISTK